MTTLLDNPRNGEYAASIVLKVEESFRARLLVMLGAAVMLMASMAHADEVDDILKTKTRNRDRLKKMKAEYVIETTQPNTVKNPKVLKMRYTMSLERLPAPARAKNRNPWRMQAEVSEPLAMNLKVEGDQVFFLDHNGAWITMELTPELEEQFSGMSERFLGADPQEQKRHFEIKVIRHNNPIFGPKTKTIEYKPKGKAKLFSRMQEDVDGDGLPPATRIYDDNGNQTVEIKVKKHRKVNGHPIVDVSEGISDTPAGRIHTRTTCSNPEVETE